MGRPRWIDDASFNLAYHVRHMGEVAWQGLSSAPASALNAPIGPHRRFESTTVALSDLQAVKRRLGGTVNDVVLAVG